MCIRRAAGLVLICVASVISADPAPEIANLYVAEALSAFASGELEQARRIAELALEFDPTSSDALTIHARATSHEQRATRAGIASLEKALATGQFNAVSRGSAVVDLAALYNRTGASAEARLLLESFELLPTSSWELRADYAFEHVRALYDLEEFETGDAALELARDLHPNDARLARLAVEREPLPSLEYRRELERLIDSLDGTTEFDQVPGGEALGELLLAYGLAAPTIAEKRWAGTEYLRLGYADPLVSILFIDDDPEWAAGMFDDLNGPRSLVTAREFANREALGLIASRLAEFSGESRLDSDRDGNWEVEFQVVDGVIIAIARDENQDGIPELVVNLADGEVTSATIETDAARFDVSYHLYPFVQQLAVHTEAGEERFVLRPRSSVVRLLRELPRTGLLLEELPELEAEIRVPDVAEVRSLALRIDTVDDRGRRVERVYQAGGNMVLIARDENFDGEFDSLTMHSGGFAVRGVRDIDFDGYFEVVEEFRSGRRVAMAVDEDDDGFPEILEYERTSTIRDWDLNEDGRIDVREFLNWSDSIIREFPLAEQE